MKKETPIVTVYVTSHNYGRYLREAVDSVLKQTLSNWELFIMNDGSSDDTEKIALDYEERYPQKITVISTEQARGLRNCANDAIERSRGKYVIRLDADDYFDESALLVMTHYLESNPNIDLVYPNWVYVSESGGFLGIENRKKVGSEAKLLDLPAHGACTMIKRRVIKSVGGYDPSYDSQDGHELWLKVLDRYKIGNIETPLFFYRQHGESMTRDENRILNARAKIKRGLSSERKGNVKPRIVAILPAKNSYKNLPNIALNPLRDKPLIDYTIQEAEKSGLFETIFVSTDDQEVVNYCDNKYQNIIAEVRPKELSLPRATLSDVLCHAVKELEENHDIYPDIVVLLSLHSPLRKAGHIQKAIDTLILYNVDNVISVYEDFEVHFLHGENGLEALNPGMLKMLRYEREALFVDNGAVHAFWRDFTSEENLYKGRIGHVVMPKQLSFQIKKEEDLKLIESVLQSEEERVKNN